MQTKLTLRMDEELISKAKRFSRKTGRSLSRIVADYFDGLDVPPPGEIEDITPKVAALMGMLKGAGGGTEDYYRHLEGKHSK